MERKASDVAERAAETVLICRPDGLGGVLDDHQIVRLGDVEDGGHVRHPTGQMHRHDGPRLCRDGGGDLADIDILVRTDVHEHGLRAHMDNGGRARDEGVRNGDDLIPTSDPGSEQAEHQRIRAGIDHNRMPDPKPCGEVGLQSSDQLAADVVSLEQGLLDQRKERATLLLDLSLHIHIGNAATDGLSHNIRRQSRSHSPALPETDAGRRGRR